MILSINKEIPIEIFPDDVFLVSYPKSGRTWLRFLIGNYLSGNKCDFTNSYLIVPGIDYNPQQCSQVSRPRFIQSHWPFTPDFRRVVYIVRDGRDVAVSYYFHMMKFRVIDKETRFEDFLLKFNAGGLDRLTTWSSHVNLWLDNAPDNLLLVKYEEMKANPVRELIRILEFAGLSVEHDAASAAVEASRFERMRYLESTGKLYEELANTDLSIPHIRSGQVGAHNNFFTDELMANFLEIHRSALERMGYLNNDSWVRVGGKQVRKLELKEFNYRDWYSSQLERKDMIEANNPEINVDELMHKIREEVDKRQKISVLEDTKNSAVSAISAEQINNIELLLNDAESNSQIPTEFPAKLNRFPFNIKWLQRFILKLYGFLFKKQRVVNLPLIQAVRDSLALNRQLIEQVTALQVQVNVMGDRINATQDRLSGTGDRITATQTQVNRMGDRINGTQERLSGMGDRITATQTQVNQIGDRITATQTQVNQIGDRITATQEQVNQIGDRITATQEQVNQIGDRITATQEQANQISDHINVTQTQVSGMGDRLIATEERLSGIGEHITTIDERYIRNDSYLKNDLAQQKRLITLFLEEARLRLPEPFTQEQLQTLVNEDQHLLDAFYVALEDRFRGSREEIIGRLIVYLPLIQKAKVGTQDSPILDVGCGRGEWLELLRQAGYTARGLDINRVMIEQCRVRGLEAVEGDVISYLQSLPDASLGAVTGFHIIEHLPLPMLIKFLNETLRVLKSGGVAIFETPNPQNMLVGSNNFYMDPTHLNPLPSLLSKFLLENTGFESIEVMNLHPYAESFKVSGSEIAERFNDYFYGPQDYAVFGYKV